MSPNFFPACAIFLMSMIVLLPKVLCLEDQQLFESCRRQYDCGNMTIGYPFWGGDRPQSCGYPGFELTCSGEAPQFTMAGVSYRVLDINNSSNTLTVSRADYWDTNCPAQKVNTTLDPTLFSYNTSYPEVTIYYECSHADPSSYQFNCSDDSISYYVIGDTNLTAIMSCKENVRVPISQTAEPDAEDSSTVADRLTAALKSGFGLEWNASNEECKGCVESDGQCGYQSSQFACYCENGTSASTCQSATISPPPGSSTKSYLSIAVGIPTGVAGVLVILAGVMMIKGSSGTRLCLEEQSRDDRKVEEFLRHHGSLAPKRYNYSDIKKMTNSFTCKLGQGGYGCVYKGKLSDDRLVAVKVLSELKGNGEEFMNEIASIGKTSHVNIVMLLGFCLEGAKRALIYEFMPSGSLDKFIRETDLQC